jgi:hypothetical protein
MGNTPFVHPGAGRSLRGGPRHRTGAALQAIRDDEEAAAALGVRTAPLKVGSYVLAGFGGGAAGGFALFLPRGLWSLLTDRIHLRILPVGYDLRRRASKET